MTFTGRFRRFIGIPLLSLAVLGAGSALAQEVPKAPPQTTITVEANTKPKNLANDLLFSNNYRTTWNSGPWAVAMENNLNGGFKDGDDFLGLSYNKTLKGVDFSLGTRFSDNSLEEISLYGGKTLSPINAQERGNPAQISRAERLFDGTRINGVVVAAGDHFALAKTIIDDVNVNGALKADIALAYKTFDWSKGLNVRNGGWTGFGGLHTPTGTAGVWGGVSVDKDYALVASIDKPDVAAVGFAKHKPDVRGFDNPGFAGIYASFGNDGKRIGGMFTPNVSLGFAEDLSGNTVPPYVGSAPSYLVTGGKFGSVIGFMNMPGTEYVEAQFGGKVRTFSNGSQLYVGGGPKFYLNGTKVEPTRMGDALKLADNKSISLEGAYVIPADSILPGTSITLEGRAAPDTTLSLRVKYTKF